MSHRKVHSQGNVPFSWEQKPGVSKFSFPDFHIQLQALTLQSSNAATPPKIPPPPCRLQGYRPRNSSGKGVKWGDDPFLVAYKECTKSGKNGKLQRGSKAKGGDGGKKSKLLSFSCKSSSCEVRDDSFLKISHPPNPKPKLREDAIHVVNWKYVDGKSVRGV